MVLSQCFVDVPRATKFSKKKTWLWFKINNYNSKIVRQVMIDRKFMMSTMAAFKF